jgi:hypothetical protein
MRYQSKVFVVTVGLLLIGALSSSARANEMPKMVGNDKVIGAFTLAHPTQWNNTMLPAGDYTFSVTRGLEGTNVLSVQGAKQAFTIVFSSQSACETCKKTALNVAVQADNRVVTSLDLPGFHLNFNNRQSASERKEELVRTPEAFPQVAAHVATN